MAVKSERPVNRGWARLLLLVSIAVHGVLACYWGRFAALPQASAAPPAPAAPEPSTNYSNRVVAYINGTTALTREELGEYLIARHGAQKLELFVNKKIIDMACQQRGIEVTAAEVDAALAEDLKGLNVNLKDFVTKVLKHYNKSLYEWKEDVIRPKLLMNKLCRDRVLITEDDLQKAYEAHYGEKIDCRIIMWPLEEKKLVMTNIYGKIRDNPQEFERAARQQKSQTLAASGGQIKPIGRYTTGEEQLEQVAFSLQPGELSQVIETREGVVVLKCVNRVPPEATRKMADVKAELEKEIFEKKLVLEIPKLFKELRDKANPQYILPRERTQEEIERDVEQEIRSLTPPPGKQGPAPGK